MNLTETRKGLGPQRWKPVMKDGFVIVSGRIIWGYLILVVSLIFVRNNNNNNMGHGDYSGFTHPFGDYMGIIVVCNAFWMTL